MEFELNAEQTLLHDSVSRFVEKEYSFEQRNTYRESTDGFSRDNWRQFAELGWLSVSLPEAYGGLGGGATENAIICDGLGKAMALEPFVSTVVVAAQVLAQSDDEALKSKLLPQIGAGELLMSLAYAEPDSRYDLHHVATTATPSGNGFAITGAKHAALDAPSADKLIVSARISGDTRDETGIALFLVDREANGLSLKPFDTMDGGRAATLDLKDTPAELLIADERGLQVLERATQWGTSAVCAQAAGAMNAAYDQTLEYVKTRKQFGVSIGSFQVLQHRLVDVFMQVNESRSMMHFLAQTLMNAEPAECKKATAAAKAFIGKRARAVAQDVVQIHGGVGMTEELAIGHYFRYLTLFCSTFGSTDYHLRQYAALTQG